MYSPRLFNCAVIAAVVLSASWGQRCFSAYTELTSPGVSFSESYPKADRERVRAVLSSKKYEFAGGRSINSFTTLTYRGDTQALNTFLDDLAKCPGLTIHISLRRPGSSAAFLSDVDWAVSHEAAGNRFQIMINLASPKIDLEKLYLPQFQSAAK